jgi:predicted acyl esterase
LALVLCLALPLVARAAPPPPGSPVPKPLEQFFSYRRTATFGSRVDEVRVPMRDGVKLDCYLYRPTERGTARPAPGRFPGIINNFTPYWIAYPAGAFHGEFFAERGYLDLECTPRGTGMSEGVFHGWFSAIENRDNYDLIEWLAARSDSTGRIGQHGNSYGGMTAYRVASLHPPHLAAIAPQQSYASLYLDFAYPGGIRSLGDPYWFGFAGATGAGHSLASTQEVSWAQHSLRDGYWKQIDIDTKWSQITVPVLAFGGWPDVFQDGMARNAIGLQGPDRYFVSGPWVHGNTFDATVTKGALLAWFDRWLYRNPFAPLPPTPAASFVMPSGPWQTLPAWPDPEARTHSLSLTASGGLADAAPVGGTATYSATPAAGAVDTWRDHLAFRSQPFAAPEIIGGAGTLRLSAALRGSPPVDTNFVVHLTDIGPSGNRTLITRGYLKASHLSSHEVPAVLPAGQLVTYRVPLWHVHYRVAAGHRLELWLGNGENDCCFTSAPAAAQPRPPLTVAVATGPSGSVLDLPVTPG